LQLALSRQAKGKPQLSGEPGERPSAGPAFAPIKILIPVLNTTLQQIKKFSYQNSLTLVFMGLFIVALLAQAFTGWKDWNAELQMTHAKQLGFISYMGTGHFFSATFENFQSEFLQMGLYVVLTIHLRQLGSAESKGIGENEEVDRDPEPTASAPWPVRKGGLWLKIYSHSLSLAFMLLFLISWGLHLYGSLKHHNDEQVLKHQPADNLMQYLGEPTFWFETFQNWQSEFLSVASIVFLTIYLRQKGSPESKPVDASNTDTGK
jgi:hypothetical protein